MIYTLVFIGGAMIGCCTAIVVMALCRINPHQDSDQMLGSQLTAIEPQSHPAA